MMTAIPASTVKIPFSNDYDAESCFFTARTFGVGLPHEIARIECERLCHLVSWLVGHPQGLLEKV